MSRTRSAYVPYSLDPIQRALSTIVFSSGGLAIKGASSALAKTASAIKYIVDGVLCTKAAADMAALSGATVADGEKQVYVFTVNAAGTLATLPGTKSTTLAGIVWPDVNDGQAVIGYLLVENGTGADFVPGTTALDVASLTTTYVNTPYPFLPGIQALD